MRTESKIFPDFAKASRILILATLLAGALALAACGKANGDSAKDGKDEVPAVPVEVAATQRAEMAALYTGTAPIESDRKAFVMPKVQGEIRQVLADEGQRVRAGQTLARLDGDKLRLEVALYEATMNKLDRDYKRNLELQQKGLVSATSLDNLKYELEAAKASWDLARLQLSYCDIRSPIEGTVTQRLDVVKVGNTVTPVGGVIESADSSLFVVENLDTLMLRVNVPERELAKLSVGQPAELTFDAVPNRGFKGEISLISPYVNAATATFAVRIRVSKTDGLLRPGMFARVAIVYERKPDALQIPRTALLDGDGPPKVFVIKDGKAAERAGDQLTSIVDDAESVFIVGVAPPPPRGWQLEPQKPVLQMICNERAPDIPGPPVTTMTSREADDMMELTALVFPGFFRARTLDMGGYLGIYDGSRLASMAGERMRLDGYQELSAVCTHPGYTGRGYAQRLLAILCNSAFDRGFTPFLHVYADNSRAIGVYRKLSFVDRTVLPFWALHH